jgi:triphosphoribosyl-dephospho-CoA synthase
LDADRQNRQPFLEPRPSQGRNARRVGGQLPVGTCATLACLLEVTAAKPGNVYRGADFGDMTYADMLISAAVIGPVMERAPERRVGKTILEAVEATHAAVGTNTNLGTLLLIAPLAKVPRAVPVAAGIESVLAALDADDASDTYRAIQVARPGGLGRVTQADIDDGPVGSLRDVMGLAADRDLVARQYVNGFRELLGNALPLLLAGLNRGCPLDHALVDAQLRLLAETPDSLIARKCGPELAGEASTRARAVLAAGSPSDATFHREAAAFDFWLRSDGNRRNPGTTADLLAAALFVALREDQIEWPLDFYPVAADRAPTDLP